MRFISSKLLLLINATFLLLRRIERWGFSYSYHETGSEKWCNGKSLSFIYQGEFKGFPIAKRLSCLQASLSEKVYSGDGELYTVCTLGVHNFYY